jgi:hypothetical protein
VDAVEQLPQLGQRLLGLLVGGVDLDRGGGARGEVELGQAERHRQRDQPLPGAVVEVALDPPPVQLEGVDQARPRPGDSTRRSSSPGSRARTTLASADRAPAQAVMG